MGAEGQLDQTPLSTISPGKHARSRTARRPEASFLRMLRLQRQETAALPEDILLRGALRMRRIAGRVSIVATGTIPVGYIFNTIL